MGTIKGSYTEFGTTVYTPTYNISVAADSLSTVTLEGTIEKDHFTNDDWKKENLGFGIEQREISGHLVRITDLERSVCDAAKYRNKIGLDIFAEVLRTYLRKDGRSLGRLMEYAKKLRIEKVLKNYIEIAIE
jgi:hypothetical protein